jgi:hypothetical protein
MKYAILVISLVVMAYLVIDFNRRTAELNYLSSKKDEVVLQLAEREGTKTSLQTQVAYATSEAAVDEYAYTNHLLRPGDVAVVPIQPAGPTPAPTPVPQPVATQTSFLQHWLQLIFGPP